MRLAFIPFALLIVPIMEIAVFIVIGDQIGLWSTLGLIFLTALLGTLILRHQGFQLLADIRTKTNAGEVPGRELVHGVMLLIAGILLLTPGFVTDMCGFLLFLPPLRDAIWGFLKNNLDFKVLTPQSNHEQHEQKPRGPTIDLDATEFSESDPNSPWNKK